jgi:hypothetical protein
LLTAVRESPLRRLLLRTVTSTQHLFVGVGSSAEGPAYVTVAPKIGSAARVSTSGRSMSLMPCQGSQKPTS